MSLNLIHSRSYNVQVTRISSTETFSCSCDTRRKDGLLVQSQCVNTSVLHSDACVIKTIRTKLQSGFSGGNEEREAEVFGTWVNVNGRNISVGEESEDEIICIQMEQVEGQALTERVRTIAKRCSGWNILDVHGCTLFAAL